jgi:hypothetical protein
MFLFLRQLLAARCTFTLALITCTILTVSFSEPANGAAKKKDAGKIAFANLSGAGAKAAKKRKTSKRYPKPAFYGKALPEQQYRGLILIGAGKSARGAPSNAAFYHEIKEAIDLIQSRAPKIYALMKNVNPTGRRVIYYTGQIGPASFASWGRDYVVNVSATNIHKDPVFENSVYSLAATLVHELVGHGRQQADNRVWAMYDWCGKDSKSVNGVIRQTNHRGVSSGFVEYEANLFSKWFLESVRGTYPNLNEAAVKRYVKIVRLVKRRFPGWYDDRKSAKGLLVDFKSRFKEVCPGMKFTPHPVR